MKTMTEVLAPAGSYESLVAAVNAGADAVYLGGEKFGARAYAENFSTEVLLQAIDFIHLHKKKIYLTVNTLLKEDELREQLYPYLLPLYEAGLDAVIVQDLGVLSFIREVFPDLPVHASTQMTVTGPKGAGLLENMGVVRVVPARELSLKELRAIRMQTNLEIETFVHGALCYCYSGQCLFSSMIGGRSGNRGRCAQPCRMPYEVSCRDDSSGKIKRMNGLEDSYALSPRDICTLEILPDIIEAGVDSLKIEGRMKKPEYAAAVTAMYRKYVDLYQRAGREGYHVEAEDIRKLADIYNRGGFSEGYYKKRNGKELLSLNRPNHTGVAVGRVMTAKERQIQMKITRPLYKGDVLEIPCTKGRVSNWTAGGAYHPGQLVSIKTEYESKAVKGEDIFRIRSEALLNEVREGLVDIKKKEKINGSFILMKEKPAILKLEYGNMDVTVTGDAPAVAENLQVTAEQAKKQLRKLGATPFEWNRLIVRVEDGLFYPVAAFNRMRREAMEKLEALIGGKHKRDTSLCEFRKYNFFYNLDKKGKDFIERPQVPDAHRNSMLFESKIYAGIAKPEQLGPVLRDDRVSRVYVELSCGNPAELRKLARVIKKSGRECFFAYPYSFREKVPGYTDQTFAVLDEAADGYLVRNLEELAYLSEKTHKPLIGDAGLYSFNTAAREMLRAMGISGTTLPFELNAEELDERGIYQEEMIQYGYQPLMVTAGCLKKTYGTCDGISGHLFIRDRKNMVFPVVTVCDYCCNVIYNSVPLYLADLADRAPVYVRYHFTVESEEETAQILSGEKPQQITRGHYRRGVT